MTASSASLLLTAVVNLGLLLGLTLLDLELELVVLVDEAALVVCFGVDCLQSTFIGQSHSPVFELKYKSSSHARTE